MYNVKAAGSLTGCQICQEQTKQRRRGFFCCCFFNRHPAAAETVFTVALKDTNSDILHSGKPALDSKI